MRSKGTAGEAKPWIIASRAVCVAILMVMLLAWFGTARADETEPREGHFTAPDTPLTVTGASALQPGFYQTSEFMIGRVAVGLILLESDGTLDPELSTWTADQRQRVLDEVRDGLAWWSNLSPDANLTFIVDDHATQPVATRYEPIRHPQVEEGLWIGEALSKLGYGVGTHWTRVRTYVNALRSQYDADWAFAIFVVNSAGDADAAFADRYFAYAYVGGPFLVMTYDNAGYGIANMDAVTAHEVGHIFRALDQYASANIGCTARSGYLGVETQNSQREGCASNVNSIMRGGVYPYTADAIDPYGAGQIGWRDSDDDGVFDPVDTTPALKLDPAAQVDGTWHISGEATDAPYPLAWRPPVTINDVSVEYRIDAGAWQSAEPADGGFDSPHEGFSLQFRISTVGNHRVELRARTNAGNVSQAESFTIVVLDPVDGGLDTRLDSPAAQQLGNASADGVEGLATSYRDDGSAGPAIARVEYRIDGGAWQTAGPQDGAFDGAEESFAIPTRLSGGAHLLEARAIDANGKVEQNTAALQVEVGHAVYLPMLQR